ncbi:MAG TPA: HAD-IA family hydrolase [Rhizomicrobium sp.]
MYQAVIWDFGGVFTSSPFEAFARYERENGLPENLLRQINGRNHLTNAWARFERAELTIDEFDKAFADEALALGHYVPGKDVIALLAGDFRPEMHEALRRIKQRYKTGCITNNVPSMQATSRESEAESMQAEAEQAEEQNAPALGPKASRDTFYRHEIMALFDHVIESSKVGIRKPDPRIYEMMCTVLGVQPSACIYLDDLGVNLKPARALGMHTIKVESAAQAIAELEAATAMALR